MAIERLWTTVSPVSFAANGGADGTIIITDTCGFKVKQSVVVSAISLPDLVLEVKRVVSPTKLIVGPKVSVGKMIARQDLSAYTLAQLSSIRAEEQSKVRLPPPDIIQAVYEQEPTIALRTIGVDCYGSPWTKNNPIPITGNITSSPDEPTKQQIQNISLNLANTEYSITLPDDTKRYQIRIRDHKAKGKMAFVPGETATNYWTITRGTIVDSHTMNLPINSMVYIRTDKASMVAEVRAWVKI